MTPEGDGVGGTGERPGEGTAAGRYPSDGSGYGP